MDYKLNQTNLKHILCSVLFFLTLLLNSYSLFRFDNFFVTLFFPMSIVVVVYAFAVEHNFTKDNIIFVFLFYVFFHSIFWGLPHPTAFILILFYIITYLCSYRNVRKKDFENKIDLFQKVMNVLAFYGIYQFVGRIISLPFTDLVIPDHMVEGFNWTNLTFIGGMCVSRSNAIFLEPSVFSQFLAMNIALYLYKVYFFELSIKEKRTFFFFLILNFFAILTTLSGTGFIILFFSLTFSVLLRKRYLSTIIYHGIKSVFITSVILFFLAAFLKFDFFGYLTNRITELFAYDELRSSGFLRFTGAFMIMTESFKENFLFGCGLGEIKYFTQTLYNLKTESNGYVANGIARIGTELGFAGLIFWLLFLFSNMKRWINNNSIGLIFVLSACAMNLTMESFSSAYFWMILCFTNVSIVEDY